MKQYDYKKNDLIFKTITPVIAVWTLILYSFYLRRKVKGLHMPHWIYGILGIPYIWAIQGIYSINNDTRGQGLIIDRPSCLNLNIPESLKQKGFVGLYKPECRSAQQKIGFVEASGANQVFNYVLNILFLLILIFISMKVKIQGNLNYRMIESTTILVFILLLGTLVTSGFIVFPWRAIVFTRMGLGFTTCAASLLAFIIVSLTYHSI
tara:strand:- start:1357 stop:1980 length:624 start_codon:yes stop_codon:yes gene_type:complete